MSVDVVSLRKDLREARRNLSESFQRAHATAVAKHLLASNLFENTQNVAVYLSCDGEVSLNPVIERLHSAEVPLVAPRIDGEYMAFFSIEPNMELARNRWGIQEPTGEQFVAAKDLSVALVPLVAFTADGDRLGRGGGYYDRYFADATTLHGWHCTRITTRANVEESFMGPTLGCGCDRNRLADLLTNSRASSYWRN